MRPFQAKGSRKKLVEFREQFGAWNCVHVNQSLIYSPAASLTEAR